MSVHSIAPVEAQVTAKLTCAVAPAVTVVLLESPPSALQLFASPLRSTVWLPLETSVKLTLPFTRTGFPAPAPSNVTVYPSGSAGNPEVETVTCTAPVVALQLIAKLTFAVAPVVTVTGLGLAPCTKQAVLRPASRTLWAPGARFCSVVEAVTAIGVAPPPSTAKVYPSASVPAPVVAVLILRFPAPAGGAAQLIVYATLASAPAMTVTDRMLSP
jgi:hypothetical protein